MPLKLLARQLVILGGCFQYKIHFSSKIEFSNFFLSFLPNRDYQQCSRFFQTVNRVWSWRIVSTKNANHLMKASGEWNSEENRRWKENQMEMAKRRNNFPFPSRVEGFLDCCGEYIYSLIHDSIGKWLQKFNSTPDNWNLKLYLKLIMMQNWSRIIVWADYFTSSFRFSLNRCSWWPNVIICNLWD